MNCLVRNKTILLLFFLVTAFSIRSYTQATDTLAANIISGPETKDITETTVEIKWKTDELTTGFVEFGTDSSLLNSVDVEELETDHEVELTDLLPGTQYFFRVGVVDTAGNGPTYSDIEEFTTKEEEISESGLKIINDKIELTVGDSIQVVAVYADKSGKEIDTTFVWSIVPDSLGVIDIMGMFTATHIGKGYIYVQVGTLIDSVRVTLKEKQYKESLVIIPGDTTVQVGSTIQFSAFYIDENENAIDTVVEWSLHGHGIGTISNDGILNVLNPGVGFVRGKLDNFEGTSTIFAVDTSVDPTGVNTADISRVFPWGKILPPHRVEEGHVYVIGGLPFPLNLLNAGWVYFPMGSLHEDISIHIKLPTFAKVDSDTVTFGHRTVAGVDFDVLVANSTIETYHFDKPLNVAIPFKRGLLEKLEINPADLSVFYAIDSVTFDPTGIYNIIVDSVSNRIFAQVSHFSTLVVRERGSVVHVKQEHGTGSSIPKDYAVLQNYPNPFNPVTNIFYKLPVKSPVVLKVYNILGEEIKVLVNKVQAAGTKMVIWDATDNSGKPVTSGIYFYQIIAGQFNQTKKMILLR